MKIKIIFLFLLQFLSAFGGLNSKFLIVYGQPVTQQWVARYDGHAHLSDVPVALATDGAGNSYLTGYSFIDAGGDKEIATVKISTSGIQQWAKTYRDTTMPENLAVGIAIDGSGNSYVTGWSGNINYPIKYTFLLKYDTSGNLLWVKKYYGTISITPPRAIAIDKYGNIFVTGSELISQNHLEQTYLIKYNSNGDTLWKRNHVEPGYDISGSWSIAIDTSGNVYLGGGAYLHFALGSVYLIIKYNTIGSELWSKTYGDPNLDYGLYKIAVDKNSNAYVTGWENINTGSSYDMLTIKYNFNGVPQWVKTYNRNVDYAYNLAIDYSGNIIVVGESNRPQGGGPNYTTIKYTPAGDTQWVRIYADTTSNPYDEACFICIDSSNNVYVSGRSNPSSAIIKYSPTGVQLWKIMFPYLGGMGIGGGGLALDNYRNVYAFGGINAFGTDDFLLVKYSQLSDINIITHNLPDDFKVMNKPNPFNPKTIINFTIPYKSEVEINIYDILGKIVETLIKKDFSAGEYEINWNANSYSSGIYFCRVNAVYTKSNQLENYSNTIKLVLSK